MGGADLGGLTPTDENSPPTLAERIAVLAEERPEGRALVWSSGHFTWGDLRRRVAEVAAGLAAREVEPGDRVVSATRNRPEALLLFAACAEVGAVFAPLRPDGPAASTRGRLEALEPSVVVAESSTRGVDAVDGEVVGLGPASERPLLEELAEPSGSVPDDAADAEDDALIVHTSGTSGEPRGAVHTWASLYWNHVQFVDALELDADATNLAAAPFHHIAGLNVLTMPVLYAGGTNRIEEFEPVSVADRLDGGEVTCTFMVPAMWRAVLEEVEEGSDGGAFRVGVVGGAPSGASLAERAASVGWHLVRGYGMTEAGPMVSLLDTDDLERHDWSVGEPGAFVDVRVVDEGGDVCEDDGAGRLQVRGPNLMERYWREPEATVAAFDGDWFRTDDLGRLREGEIELIGRSDDVILTAGEKVPPAPVERLVAGHPDLRDAAVVGTEHQKWGQAVTAIVVPHFDDVPTLGELRDWVGERFSEPARPRRLVVADRLPRGHTGKVDRSALVEDVASGDLEIVEDRDA